MPDVWSYIRICLAFTPLSVFWVGKYVLASGPLRRDRHYAWVSRAKERIAAPRNGPLTFRRTRRVKTYCLAITLSRYFQFWHGVTQGLFKLASLGIELRDVVSKVLGLGWGKVVWRRDPGARVLREYVSVAQTGYIASRVPLKHLGFASWYRPLSPAGWPPWHHQDSIVVVSYEAFWYPLRKLLPRAVCFLRDQTLAHELMHVSQHIGFGVFDWEWGREKADFFDKIKFDMIVCVLEGHAAVCGNHWFCLAWCFIFLGPITLVF